MATKRYFSEKHFRAPKRRKTAPRADRCMEKLSAWNKTEQAAKQRAELYEIKY